MVPLTVAVVLACVLGLANLLLTAGLARRLRELRERVLADESADLWWPASGTPVGDFRATTVDGRELGSADLAGADVVVAFVSPTCPPCTELAASLVADPPPGRVLAFVLTDDPSVGMVADLRRVADVCLVTEESGPTRAFHVSGWPTVLRVTDGTVAAAGYRRDALGPAVPVRAGR